MYLRWSMFKDYCLKNNIKLLSDDIKFISKILIKIPPELHRTILFDYCKEWIKVMRDNIKSSQAQNLARKTANRWLFEEVNRRKAQKAPVRI